MPKPIKNSRLAFIGLIILFAYSLVMAGGRIPKTEPVNATLRPLSVNEVMEILQKFPEMVPDNFKDEIFNKGDENVIKDLFNFRELEDVDLLKHLFPTVRFIKANKFTKPPLPYLMAISDDKRYENVPSLFNRLLLDNGIEVNNKNIIELAKAFVIIALEGKEITFLEGKSSVDKKKDPPIYRVHLKVEVNNQKQIYGFHIKKGQFQWVTMDIEGGTTTKWFDLEVIEDTLKRGELDLEGQIKISTVSPSSAYFEREGNIYHYYLIVGNSRKFGDIELV